ncbi:MAG TPA: aromatic ring-hydroxylating dioxygenase subunit alpha [Sneathiellales bacterium]|nr:aromatic ring-hydroxylating dioxygenase subunit alpha [Sneathiellales bacterium]
MDVAVDGNGKRMETDYGKRWTQDYPELGTDPVPVASRLTQEYFDRERDTIFSKSWLNVGREEQIAETGDFFVQDIAVCKASVLLVRGKDGESRGFHNVCPHRASKLVWGGSGCKRTFTCKFHGWTFDESGQLVGVPDEDGFYCLDKSENGLVRVATEVWNGFIFVNLDPNPKESLQEYLGEWGERLADYPFQGRTTCYAYQGEINANWKLCVSAFNEGYHVPFVHPMSAPETFRSKKNLFCRPIWVKLYPRHQTYSFYANPDSKMTALEALSAKYGPIVSSGPLGCPPGANPAGDPDWALDANVVFPNFFVDVANDWYFTYNFWPIAPDRTFYQVKSYFVPPKTASERFAHEYGRVLLRDVLLEDVETIEHTQLGLASGVRSHYILQDSEILIRHHLKTVENHVENRV